MPDADGISWPFPDGAIYCHQCGTWISRGNEERRHRAVCGRRWRQDHANGRPPASVSKERAAIAAAINTDQEA